MKAQLWEKKFDMKGEKISSNYPNIKKTETTAKKKKSTVEALQSLSDKTWWGEIGGN